MKVEIAANPVTLPKVSNPVTLAYNFNTITRKDYFGNDITIEIVSRFTINQQEFTVLKSSDSKFFTIETQTGVGKTITYCVEDWKKFKEEHEMEYQAWLNIPPIKCGEVYLAGGNRTSGGLKSGGEWIRNKARDRDALRR